MEKKFVSLSGLLISFTLLISACGQVPVQAVQNVKNAASETPSEGVETITGDFEYTNGFVVETYYVEHAVALLDMTGFVLRNKEWELPVDSQVLGFMALDAANKRATFHLSLPEAPEGVFNDVDQNASKDKGVQIYAVGYSPNLSGGVFSEGDDRSLGWPSYLASVKTDTENKDEVIGGKLVVWAPDDAQQFPSGFGADGLLFTKDDPVAPVPAGFSIIDLDQKPFKILRDTVSDLKLYEPADVAVKDYSKLSYKDSFDKLFQTIRKEYAFNGIAGKEPNWDALYADLAPKVSNAQAANDSYAYYTALRQLMMSFKDGHVSLDGGANASQYNQSNIAGGLGFAVKELDDSRVLVVYVLAGGPADQAGMKVGAEVLAFNGDPIQTALGKVKPFQPQSTDFGLRNEQTVFLTRSGIGQNATVEFANPGQASTTAQLTAVGETDSLFNVYDGGPQDPNVLPAEYKLYQDSGVGYIKLNSNYDDLGLIVRIVNRALKTFQDAGSPGIVIDLRHNFGGSPLGLAGFLYNKNILLGQLEYYSDKTGKFEAEGPRDKVFPNTEQYSFGKMVLLVDQFCFSACEIEAYGFSQVPNIVVMGQSPTAGVEAETARGKFLLPEGMVFDIPTGRYTLPDGSIFLEGKGVQPTVKVPVDEASVLSGQDTVLQKAISTITGQ